MPKVSSLPDMTPEEGDRFLIQKTNGMTALSPLSTGGSGSTEISKTAGTGYGFFIISNLLAEGKKGTNPGYYDDFEHDLNRFLLYIDYPEQSSDSGYPKSKSNIYTFPSDTQEKYNQDLLRQYSYNGTLPTFVISVDGNALAYATTRHISIYGGEAAGAQADMFPHYSSEIGYNMPIPAVVFDEEDKHQHIILPHDFFNVQGDSSSSFFNVYDGYGVLPIGDTENLLIGISSEQAFKHSTNLNSGSWDSYLPNIHPSYWGVVAYLMNDDHIGECGDYAYQYITTFTCPGKTLLIANGLHANNIKSARYMFQFSRLGDENEFPNANFENLVNARGMFANTYGQYSAGDFLKRTFPKSKFQKVENADSMFFDSKFKNFTWDSDILTNIKTASHMFERFGNQMNSADNSTGTHSQTVSILVPKTLPYLEDASWMFANFYFRPISSRETNQSALTQASIDSFRNANWPKLKNASHMFYNMYWYKPSSSSETYEIDIDLGALSTVNWPELEDIDYMFYGTYTYVDMAKEGNFAAFKHLLSLAKGKIDHFFYNYTSNVKNMPTELTDIEIATGNNSFITSSYTENPFSYFTSFENVTFTNLPDTPTNSDNNYDYYVMFYALKSYKNVTFSKLKRIRRLGNPTNGPKLVENLSFPELVQRGQNDEPPLTSYPNENIFGMNQSYTNHFLLPSITNLSAPKLVDAYQLLMNLPALETVDGLTLTKAERLNNMFAITCSLPSEMEEKTKTLTLKNVDFSSATSAQGMFAISLSSNYWPYKPDTQYRNIVFGDDTVKFPVLENAKYFFQGNPMTTAPKIDNTVMPVVKDISYMFSDCIGMDFTNKDNTEPIVDLTGVENVSYMFYNIAQSSASYHYYDSSTHRDLYPLKYVKLTGVTDASYMMQQSQSTTYDTVHLDGIENIDFSTIVNADYMFNMYQYQNLTEVPAALADIDLSSLEKSNHMFRFSSGVDLASVIEGWSEKPWFEEVKARGGFDGMFVDCTSATLPTWVTSEMKTNRSS